MLKIGSIIAVKLIDKNMTQKMLANIIDVDYRTISTYVNNKSFPDLNILSRICNVLDIDLNSLLNIHVSDDNNYIIKNTGEYEICKLMRSISEEKRPKAIETIKSLCELIID